MGGMAMTMIVAGRLERAPDYAGGHVGHVNGAEDDSKGGQCAETDSQVRRFECAQDGEEFGDEAIKAGQTDAAEGEENEEEREDRHFAGEAGELVDVASVIAVVNHADD